MQVATVRKSIEAGAGVVLIGLLEYVSASTDLAAWLERLVPAALVPVVPVLLGGLALTVRVYRYANAPSAPADNLDEPAPVPSDGMLAAPGLASVASVATPPAARPVATEATDAPELQLPELRDPAAVAAVAASVGSPALKAEPAQGEPTNPPTSFIALPTR